MGQYCRGDVLLAPVALDDRTPKKTRPVIVIGSDDPGQLRICPVSSKPPFDAPSLPLAIDDFASGGLDMFGESFIMTSRVLTIRNTDVIGRKGRLTAESLTEISAQVAAGIFKGTKPGQKRSGRRGR